jgi:uncharacterized protein YfaQ (DUF2300 family)
MALILRIACVFAFVLFGADATFALAASSPVQTSSQTVRFAWLHDGRAQLWRFDAHGAPDVPLSAQSAEALPVSLETPLDSVWKLFVYGYLVDRGIESPDYACTGADPEEVYCCMTGGRIDREHALVQSCGLFFEPARLHLDPAGWRQYWTAAHAPLWLRDLRSMTPDGRVTVVHLLNALQSMPARARTDAANTLVSVLTSGRGEGTVSLYGSLLRAKTWTMPDPVRPGASIGGAAGWLADGTPVWLGGPGGSARVLSRAASAPARRAADLTDGLVLTNVAVQYHHDKTAPGQMSWLDAKAAAQRGLTFDAILART